MINTPEDWAAVGPKYAAKYQHSKGQGIESNPYPYATKARDQFDTELRSLEREADHEEFRELMGC